LSAEEDRQQVAAPPETRREIEALVRRVDHNNAREEKMLGRRLLFTSVVLLVVVASAPALAASSRPRVGQPAPLGAPSAGMRIGSEIKLSPDPDPPVAADRYAPAVAYNSLHDEYLVVWTNVWPSGTADIYARRVSRTGELLSWFCVATGLAPGGDGKSRSDPAVAYNATNDQYLVVWAYEASSMVYEIWGKIIPWNAPGTNPEFKIMSLTDRSFWAPQVAWNSNRNEYLVVWNALDTTTGFPPGTYNKIGGYRVSASGTVYNSGPPIIIDSVDYPQQADLAYNPATDEYLVVWVRYYTATGYDIYGARVSGEGALVNPPAQFVIMGTNDDEYHPAVATNGVDRYFVAWEWVSGTPPDHNVRATDLDELGNLLGSAWWSATAYSETNPDIAAAPGANEEYFIVWQQSSTPGEQIWAFRRTATTITGWFAFASRANWQSHSPAVAIGRPGYLIAYASDSLVDPAVDQHIYARLWWPEAVYVPLVLRSY